MCRWRHVSVRVVVDFGQSIFGQYWWLVVNGLANLADPFLANRFLCCVVVGVGVCVWFVCCCVVLLCCCVVCVVVLLCVVGLCPPPSAGPFRRTPLRRTALPPGPPKISLFFFPLPPQFSFFLPSLGGPFPKPPGFTWQPESPNVHIWGSRNSKTPPTFHEKTPREEARKKTVAGEGKKKARNFGPPTFRGPTFRRLIFFWVSAPPCGPHHDTRTPQIQMDWPTLDWAKVGPFPLSVELLETRLASGSMTLSWNRTWDVKRPSWFLTAYLLAPVKSYFENFNLLITTSISHWDTCFLVRIISKIAGNI